MGFGCCALGGPGVSISFSGQTNLVIWDAARGVEHFVRDARFQTDAPSLGFIAPTPTRPTLHEARASVFRDLAMLEPRDVTGGIHWMPTSSEAMKGPGSSVMVFEVRDVGGYRATVLKATDGNALTHWLRSNGYESAPWLKDWTEPYIRKGWFLTAFKVRADGGPMATGVVRMTFETDRPFNPYSVPTANQGNSPLQLFYVSAGNEEPRIGGTEFWRTPEWEAKIPWDTRYRLVSGLGLTDAEIPEGATVKAFIDPDFSRTGSDDLFFVPTARLYMEKGAVVVGLGGVAWYFRRRRLPSSSTTAVR